MWETVSDIFQNPSVASSDKVKQREQENPDNVNEMPIKSGDLHMIIAFGRKRSSRCHNDQTGHDPAPDDHMQRMQTCQHKVEDHEKLNMVGMRSRIGKIQRGRKAVQIFVPPFFVELDEEKDKAKDQRNE